ncbi:hypothetical protein SAMN04487831_101366 [Pseudobutyrivibrio sp. UC1225]|uniref:SGNH/GDSL hydrolase family protein n=1 Tax=Pseudobutyrivibrio sp. UC1225 TaxID=1798185 RepID=UPI0008E35C60|nr:SGNH/GDSL hydrolase family protein [Pseudobutyrivibrio sp. UC1225]SFN48139.1 hypothetical protein SAMN04487831_101366 [Pseudobutyrivibrio sp. UC1225]
MILINNMITRTKNKVLTYSVLALLLILFIMPTGTVRAAELGGSTQETTASEEVVFDAAFYATQYPDVVSIIGNDEQMLYWHYVNYGKAEGRFPNAQEAAKAVTATVPLAVPVVGTETLADGAYDILAIGNSITVHPMCSYWWGPWGMAASSIDKDYIHRLQNGLMEKYGTVNLDIVPVQSWETSYSRSKQLKKFDEKLAKSYDLVIIQLGENVSDMSTFKKDFNKLVDYVKTSQPDAKIVVIGDFWYRSGRDAAKKDVAIKQGCDFVDLSEIRGVKKYLPEKGSKVLGYDGKYHTITKASVLKHPNDLGMEYIANKILEKLQILN